MKEVTRYPDFVLGLPEADIPFESVKGWLAQGDRFQVVFLDPDEAAVVPEHFHREQWEFVLARSVRLTVEGEEGDFSAGDNSFISAGALRSAKVSAGYGALIFFNEYNRYSLRG